MSQAVLGLVIRAVDQTRGVLGGIKGALASLGSVVTAPLRAINALGTGLSKLGLAAQGLSVLAGTIKRVFGGPIIAASDLEEAVNKVNVVFGAAGARVHEFASRAANALGLSRTEAEKGIGVFGNLFVSMGMGQPKAADMSIALSKLAADLASFNNIDPTEALDKLRAGLVGESEPLRTLGININETLLKQEALNLGFKVGKGVLDPLVKAQAAYSLIMKQSKTAQGDFARTADGVANALRRIKAGFADAKTMIGQVFLPVVGPLIAAFADRLPGAIESLRPKLETFSQVLLAVMDAFKTDDLGRFTARINELLGINIGPFVRAFRIIQVSIGAFRAGGLSAFFDVLRSAGNIPIPPIIRQMASLLDTIASKAYTVARSVGELFLGLARGEDIDLGDLHDMLAEGGVWDMPEGLIEFQRMLAVRIPQAVARAREVLGGLGRAISGVVAVARGNTLAGFVGILSGMRSVFPPEVADRIALGVYNIAKRATEAAPALSPLKLVFSDILAGNFDLAFLDIASALQGLGKSLGIDVSPLLTALGFLKEKFDAIKQLVTDLGSILSNVFSGKIDLATGVGQALDSLKAFVLTWIDITIREWQGKFEFAKSVFTDWVAPIIPVVIGKLVEWGTQIIGWVQAQVPIWASQLRLWASAFQEWITPLIPLVLAKLGELALSLLSWLAEQIPLLATQLVAWGLAFVEWVTPMIVDFLGRLPALIDALFVWIEQNAGPIAEKFLTWAMAFVLWVIPMIPGLIANLFQVALAVLGFIVNTAITIVGHLLKWAVAFVGWVIPMIPELLSALAGMLVSLLGWVVGTALPQIVSKLLEWAGAFFKWVAPALVDLLVALAKLISAVLDWIAAQPAVIDKQLQTWVREFLAWVGDVVSKLPAELAKIGDAVRSWALGMAATVRAEALKIGEAIINGIKAGIANLASSLVDSARNVVGDAIQGAKNLLNIKSPSKVFVEIGRNVSLGMAVGIDSERDKVRTASLMMATAAVRAVPRASRGSAPAGETHQHWTLEQNNYGPAPSPIRSFAQLRAWAGS